MFSRQRAAARAKAAGVALAVLLTGASSWGQAAPSGDIVLDPAPAAAPAPGPIEPAAPIPAVQAAPPAHVAAPTAVAADAIGPEKPSANRAIRNAMIRAERDAQGAAPGLRAQLRAVDAYYASRGDAPVWFAHGQWSPQARQAFERLQKAPDDGLDLRAYRVYSLDPAPEASLALGEVALSQAVAAYAFQASGGRVDLTQLSKLVGAKPPIVGATQALDETSGSGDADAHLAGYNPGHPGYLALREKLAQARVEPATDRIASADSDRGLSDAVSAIKAGGGAAARKAALESELLVNMEFWRWMPRDMGADRIVVNVPEFVARLYRNDAQAYATRIIVGKPDTPTPLFSNRMDRLIVNPSWYVPQSIIKKEMMGKLSSLQAQGYDIQYSGGALHIRQPPGERNALGRIKFIFQNEYAVYMHDTTTKHLFSASRRAFSHGCMRVDQPLKWAVELLGPNSGYSAERIEKMYGKSERRVDLPEALPIHIGYFTASVDETGEMRRFEDVYGYERRTRELMGLSH